MKMLATAGGPLAYDVQGEGPPVLLLHAFPLGLAMWDAQVTALRGQHQVIRFDDRGFGASPPGDGLLSMERIADDAAALLDHLGVAKAVVCGLSMGGYAAFAMVRRHADRLRGLVLADTRAPADTPEGREGRAALAQKVLGEGAVAAAEAFVPKLLGETTKRERPQVVARVREIVRGNPPRGDSTPTLREIRVPTLVVCGEEDTLTPPADAEALQRGIAGSRLVLVPRAGHLTNLEDPDAFNRAFLGFLGEI